MSPLGSRIAFLGLILACHSTGSPQEKAPEPGPAQARIPAPGHWPQWRGPNRDGLSTETGLLKQWPEGGPKLLWKATGLGEGMAPVSVAGGLLFTVGYRQDSEFVTAIDGAGKIVWSLPISPAEIGR